MKRISNRPQVGSAIHQVSRCLGELVAVLTADALTRGVDLVWAAVFPPDPITISSPAAIETPKEVDRR